MSLISNSVLLFSRYNDLSLKTRTGKGGSLWRTSETIMRRNKQCGFGARNNFLSLESQLVHRKPLGIKPEKGS